METNRSWSIDDRRYNFQFGTEIGYEIKNGKLGRMLRNCTYTGITPEFWNVAMPSATKPLDDVGHAQLRQRPAGPGRSHRSRRRAGALPQCQGWRFGVRRDI